MELSAFSVAGSVAQFESHVVLGGGTVSAVRVWSSGDFANHLR